MKRLFSLFAAMFLCVSGTIGQINQDFANVSYLHTLSNKCWQFYGTLLTTSPTSADKYLSLTPVTANGSAWLRTAYIHLTSISSISFSYQMAAPLANGASHKLSVRLMALDGTTTSLGEVTIDHQAGTAPFAFQASSPVNGVQRLVIEVTTNGNDFTTLFLDNLVVDGIFEYNAPYNCRENEDGAVSIHYLKSFTGQLNNDRVRLEWVVAENENNSHFEIERSNDGKEFKTVGTVSATNKVAVENYTYEERLPATAYYRLKLVSRGGIRMFSNVLFFKSNATNENLLLLQNPVQQTLRLGFVSETKTTAQLTVYNMSGARLFQRQFDVQKNYNRLNVPLNVHMAPGIYLTEIICDGKRYAIKFLKE